MGQKHPSNRPELEVGGPLHVQHTAQLRLDPQKGIVLQVPELDAFLTQEGIPFSDRATWDVLRFVYQAGGLDLVRDTLPLIRQRRAAEPAPDYDLTSSSTSATPTTSTTPSSDRRRNWSSQGEEESSGSNNRGAAGAALRRRHGERESSSAREADSPPPQKVVQPGLPEGTPEGGDDWKSAHSSQSVQEITIQWMDEQPPPEFLRPASKVWKRAIAPEVHADLVRVLKARESLQDDRLSMLQEIEVRRTHTILILDPDING